MLPFTLDAHNSTGLWASMVARCVGTDGARRCFFKGWSDAKDALPSTTDFASWTTAMDACVKEDPGCADRLHVVTAIGAGAPSHQKFFWTSRAVYMQIEPAWFWIMSASACAAPPGGQH